MLSHSHANLVFGLGQTAEAQQYGLGHQMQARRTNVLIEGGWRWPMLGQSRIDRDEDWKLPLAYHAGLTFTVGEQAGFYTAARFDGYGPTGLGTYPFTATARVGYFLDVHGFDPGGPRQTSWTTSDTDCETSGNWRRCTTTRTRHTRRWWEPAGWVNGIRYFYAGYRQAYDIQGDERPDGTRGRTHAGAVSLGVGLIQSKFATFTNELEVLYWVYGWDEEGRTPWGIQYRGAVLFGPVFVDFTLLLDSGLGSEVSVGLGFVVSP